MTSLLRAGPRAILPLAVIPWLLAGAGCGKPEELSAADELMNSVERNFAVLINRTASGKVSRVPWAGYYWPYVKDGIASTEFAENTGRWWAPRRESPAAKYDRARGARSSADAWERKNHGRDVGGVESWWGHCNGWSSAAIFFEEPRSPVRVGDVVFNPGDIKALLTEASMESDADADFFGNRAAPQDAAGSPRYEDTVPNQFFLVLTHFIGRLGQGVLVDRFTGAEVWNQPLAGYRFDYPKPEDYLGASPEAPHVFRVLLTARIWWMRDDVKPSVLTSSSFDFQDSGTVQSRTLKMELWLDGPVVFDPFGRVTSSGDILLARDGENTIGGAWRLGNGHLDEAWPDYMWVPHSLHPSTGYANPELDIEWIRRHLALESPESPTAPRF